jgi:hypothetical protein
MVSISEDHINTSQELVISEHTTRELVSLKEDAECGSAIVFITHE